MPPKGTPNPTINLIKRIHLPFLSLSLTERAISAADLLVIAEVMFWVGVVLAGHEVVSRVRQKLNPKALWKRMVDRVRRR